jgi:hypothetical protein
MAKGLNSQQYYYIKYMDFKCLYTPSYPGPRQPQRPLKRRAYLHGRERAHSIDANINGTSIRNQPSHIRNPL